MQRPEPSREELITQITDVLGKAKPNRSKKEQALSVLASFVSRLLAVSYSIYLGLLFATSKPFFNESTDPDPDTLLNNLLLLGVFGFFLYLVFGKIYGDRLTPAVSILKRMLPRGLTIIFTFMFWTWMFSIFPSLEHSWLTMLAFYFIVAAGYGFRLRDRTNNPKRPDLESAS